MDVTVTANTGNQAPELYRALPGLTLQVGGSTQRVSMDDHFRDPNGDELDYTTVTTPARVVNVTKPRNSDVLTFEPVAAGTATVRVTAQDPGRLFTRGTIEVTVNPAGNRAPELYRALPGLTLQVGGTAVPVTLGDHFRDPDEDELDYTTVTTPAGVVNVTKPRNSDVLTFEPVAAGTATVRVTAQDPGRLFTRGTIEVTVNPATSGGTDRQALEALYDATGGARWTRRTNWKTSAPLDEWYGVETDSSGRVVRLEVDRNNLSGTIPAALGNLTQLERLDLSRNDLTGTVPPELGNLTLLERLYISWNRLRGALPESLTNLRQMRIFWFHENGGLCLLSSPAFAAWIDGIADWRGISCGQQ